MNSSFTFRQIGQYKCLIHKEFFEAGIKHGFVTNQLNLKDVDLSVPINLPGIGQVSLAKQTHGTKVLEATDFGLEGDAFIIKTGEVCGVRTADCVPLILINLKNKEIGAVVHSGWRGACTGIVETTLNELIGLGYEMKDFMALIGPSAMSCCYEVQDDVATKFSSGISTKGGHTYLSVSKYVKNILISSGVISESIKCSDICTICSVDFFSYRKFGPTAGRFLSFLSI